MLNISPINFSKINNNFAKRNYLMKQGLATDVFVKSSNNVSFKGKEGIKNAENFIQWANDTNFIKEGLNEVLSNPENIIGSGFTNTAFKIPENDDYILRATTYSLNYIHTPNIPMATIEDAKDVLDINVGQEIATIIIPSIYAKEGEEDFLATRIEVLKKQTGEAIGVQPPETLVTGEYNSTTKEGVEPYEDYSRKEKYIRTIKKVAELPVEAYEELIRTYQKACAAGCSFDHLNSNNLLVDSESKSINLIDMSKADGRPSTINYANLLYSLSNISYFSTYTAESPNPVGSTPEEMQQKRNEALQYNLQIIDKFLNAMKNTGAKFDSNSNSYEFQKFIFSLPCTMYCRSFDDKAFWNKARAMGLMK